MISSLPRRVPAWIINYSAGLRSRLEAHVFLVFAALIMANLSRAVFPGIATDLVFAAAVLVIGVMLIGKRIPVKAKPAALCFLILLGIYAVILLLNFNYVGIRQTFGIAAAGLVYVFCYVHGVRLIRSKRILSLLVGAIAIMTLRYALILRGLQSSTVTSTIMCGILVCLVLTIGIALILRSSKRARQHQWAMMIFVLVAVIGVMFGLRSVIALALLTFPLYWLFFPALRNSLIGILMAAASVAGILLVIVAFGTPSFDVMLGDADGFARSYLGGRILTGREKLWDKAIDDIEASRWMGQGVGTVIIELETSALSSVREGNLSTERLTWVKSRPVSRALGQLGDLHPPSMNTPKSAHNLFLQVGVQTGLPGLVTLAGLCLALFISLRQKGEKVQPLRSYVATYTLMFIYLSVFEVFLLQNILYWGVFAWIAIGIGAGVVNSRARGQDQPS